MIRNVTILIFLLGIGHGAMAQRYFMLTGHVRDTLGQEIPGASVRLRNDNLGTATNDKGFYSIKLEEGYYEIVVSGIGYINKSINIPLNKNVELNIILAEKHSNLKEIEVSNRRHDPSWDIIQHVIFNRNKINFGLKNYKCSGYIKASDVFMVDSTLAKKKTKTKKFEAMDIDSMEAEIKNIFPKIPNMNFAEINLIKYWGTPSDIKEERNGVRIIGDKYSLYFLSVTDGEFNFYKNQVNIGKLSEVKYVSPFSPGANLSYRYKLLGSYYEGTQKVFKIKVIPRKMGNALFEGITEIYDSIWIIKRVSFSINANHVPVFSSFNITQEYQIAENGYVLLKSQNFNYTKKDEGGKREGATNVIYTNYETNLNLATKFFGNEISHATDSAYSRDGDWWNIKRKDTLNSNERIFTHYRDSIYKVRTSKEYLDSIDKVYNKITFLKLIWWGQGYINREKKLRMDFAPLVSMAQPGSIGGFRAAFFMQASKRLVNRQFITVTPDLSYGFNNNDIKGSFHFSHLYNPKLRSRYYVYLAHEFMMINSNEAYINMFKRSNYFDQKRMQLGHVTEIINGLYFSVFITLSNRQDITNYKFLGIGDDIFKKGNQPVEFKMHQSTETKFVLSYTPKQQYIREPREKIILGSKYPTFSILYNQGVKGLLNSDVDFKYIQGSIAQSINFGRIGVAKYNMSSGKFLSKNMLPIVDYKYQRRGDPFLLTNPLGTYQLLPKTFPTFDWYLEAHYWHSFNGFITSSVPFFKRYNINASGGSSMLWAFENKMRHIEICYGINKVFKLIRESFKVGIYLANGYNNQGGYYQGIKISVENYNIRDNSWSF